MDEYLWTRQLYLQYHASNSSSMDEWHVLSLGMKKNNLSFLRDEKEIMSLSFGDDFSVHVLQEVKQPFCFPSLAFYLVVPVWYPPEEKGKFCKNFMPGMCDEWGILEASTTWLCLKQALSSGRNAPFITRYPTIKCRINGQCRSLWEKKGHVDDLDENWMGVGIESLCFVKEMGERDELEAN